MTTTVAARAWVTPLPGGQSLGPGGVMA